ncbi:MAG: phospholipase D family protein [Bacteroidales bacterium]|nr:phospholipase D family protein [Bacteroidales bacterium]
MAKFITGNELNLEVENVFKNADETLILISPFIKLHERLISVLRTKNSNPNLKIFIVFGKNEHDLGKSLRKEDLDFFKDFPNIEIRYEKRLHAKYYANERSAIISSMNLYSYSQDNNIESGVLTETNTALNNLSTLVLDKESLDVQASKYFKVVIEQAELIFKKEPVFEDKMFGLKKEYKESLVTDDRIDEFFKDSSQFEKGLYKQKVTRTNENVQNSSFVKGYCIRTGVEIPFNPQMPMCEEAYKSWSRYKDENYKEKYCHFSGEPSNGETSFAKPILKKNWSAAKEKMK